MEEVYLEENAFASLVLSRGFFRQILHYAVDGFTLKMMGTLN